MLITVEYLVKKAPDTLWWDDYLEQLGQTDEELEMLSLLPEFKKYFMSGQDLIQMVEELVDENTKNVRFVTQGATLENAPELCVWQLHRHPHLRPIVKWKSDYQKNYLSITGPVVKYQNQS